MNMMWGTYASKKLMVMGLAVLSCAGPLLYANPNHQVIDAAFPVHGSQYSPELRQKAVESYEAAKKKLFDFLEKEAKQDLQKIQAEDLGTTYVMVSRLRRAAEQLQILGEPAGADFERRADAMQSHLTRLIETSKAVPATQKYIEAFRQLMNRSGPARAKVIAELEKLVQDGKWEAAETQLYRAYDRLELGTVFLPLQETQSIYMPFSQVDNAIRTAMIDMRTNKAKQLLQIAYKESLPHFSSVITAMNMAIKELETKDTATWKGEELAAPQLVVKFTDAWRSVHAGAIRAEAKSWALRERRHAEQSDTTPAENMPDKIAADYASFCSQIVDCVSRLVEVEAARDGVEDVSGTYVEFLRALAPMIREANNVEFAKKINGSLIKLQEKTPSLDQQVKAYEAATDDMLRWRARIAVAQAAQQATEYKPLEQRLVEGTMSHEDYTGLFSEAAGAARLPQLMSPAPDVMKVAVNRLIGQKATVRDVIRVPGEKKPCIARYVSRTYAMVPAPLPLDKEIEWLKQDLLATAEETPPLSLNAMQAVVTAQRGDMVAVGGDISGLFLETVITRFAALPDAAAVMTVLGKLPAERIQSGGLSDVLMRFDITPRWAQHDYFFVRLAAPLEATARTR